MVHETTDRIVRGARTKRTREPRTRSRVEEWAWSPVVVLRVGLVALYAINVYVAIVAFLAGVPVFTRTTPDGWQITWAVALMLSALIAAICVSIDEPAHRHSKALRWAEMISAAGVFVLAGTYSVALHVVGFGSGDQNRQVVAAVSVALFVLPFVRFLWLTSQLGRTPANSETRHE